MTTIIEVAAIERLVQAFPRSPLQLNALQESDAELIHLPGTDTVLALTTDTVVEEIVVGLYTDPYLIGWMTVMVNASDLAAVGAEPLGILLNETLPPNLDEGFTARLQRGVHDACAACGFHVLGGDTNYSTQLQMGATAIGIVEGPKLMTRRGCLPGDILFASGSLGLGTAFAFLQLQRNLPPDRMSLRYLPRARLREGQLLLQFASACMDTSDGAVSTLDQLMRTNDVGVLIDIDVGQTLHPAALRVAQAAGVPPWMMLCGPHGEFELLFTVPEPTAHEFLGMAISYGWEPIEFGTVVAKPGLQAIIDGRKHVLDSARIRNLFVESGGDAERYVAELYRLDGSMGGKHG